MTDHPLVPTDFKKFIGTRVQTYILPIIPAGATLKETSALSEAQLGKIPGRFDAQAQAWVGFGSWTGNVTSAAQLERWGMWQLDTGPIATGARTGELIPIDLDSDNAKYAEMQRRLAEKHFGVTPVVRRRDGAVRAALFYWRKPHTAPIAKRSASFEDAEGSKHLTEVLGAGRHIVIEGPHAKGKMHYWESLSLVEGCDQMPEITVGQTDAYLREVAEESEAMGFTRVKMSLPKGGGDNSGAVSISNLMSPNIAKDPQLLADARKGNRPRPRRPTHRL